MKTVIDTERLSLSRLTEDDAAFMLAILNDPTFVRFVGDRGVRTERDARRYLHNGPIDSYARNGFGLYRVNLRGGGVAVGICGFVKRPALTHPDVGFAFLPAFRRKGYAVESAAAVLEYGRSELGLDRVLAITDPDNVASGAVLERVGMRFEKMIRIDGDGIPLKLYSVSLSANG